MFHDQLWNKYFIRKSGLQVNLQDHDRIDIQPHDHDESLDHSLCEVSMLVADTMEGKYRSHKDLNLFKY